MQAPAKGTKRRSISYAKWGYIFIAPFFIAFAIFQLIPLASTIYYSFFEYYRSGLKVIGPNFTGLSNYVKLLSLDLPKYLGNTLLLWILGFVPQIIVSLLLAVWFTDNRLRIRCQPFFKTVIYMPNLIWPPRSPCSSSPSSRITARSTPRWFPRASSRSRSASSPASRAHAVWSR